MLPGHSAKTNIGVGVGWVASGVAYFEPFGTFPLLFRLILSIVGSLFYFWGCYCYVTGKGRTGWLTLVGLIPFVGIFFLAILTDRTRPGRTPPYRRPGAPRKDSGFGVALGAIAVLIVLAAGGYSYRGLHPASPAEARQRALQRYPALGLRDSPLNREFVARYQRYQSTNRDYFKDTGWPLKLAAESQAAIDQAPSNR